MFCGNIDDLIGFKLNLDQRKAIENSVTSSFSLIQGPPGLYFSNVLGRERRHQPPPPKKCGLFFIQFIPFISFLLYFTFTGTGKTFTGVVLIRLFCSINKEIYSKGGKNSVVLFCGPSNKSVDLVTGILSLIFANKIQVQKTAIMLIQGLP